MAIDAAVNRNIEGETFLPEQKITAEEALMAHTYWAAYSVHEEKIKGMIKEGYLADLTLLDQNILKIDPSKIIDTKCMMTIVGGKIAF